MRIVIIFSILIFTSLNVILGKENSNIKIDSLSFEIQKLQIEINAMKDNQEKFEYQKNYFTEAIETQNGIYNHGAVWATGTITILIALIVFGIGILFKNNIKEETISFNKKMENKFDKILEDNIKVKKDIYFQSGNLYTLYANILIRTDNTNKYTPLLYYFVAMREYSLGQKHTSLIDIAHTLISIINKMPISESQEEGEEGEEEKKTKVELYEILAKIKEINNQENNENNQYKTEISKLIDQLLLLITNK
jgi:hypothetical protein